MLAEQEERPQNHRLWGGAGLTGPADCSVSRDRRLGTPQWSKYLDAVPLALHLQTGRKKGGCRAFPPQASPRQAAESEFELRALTSWPLGQLCFPVFSR